MCSEDAVGRFGNTGRSLHWKAHRSSKRRKPQRDDGCGPAWLCLWELLHHISELTVIPEMLEGERTGPEQHKELMAPTAASDEGEVAVGPAKVGVLRGSF